MNLMNAQKQIRISFFSLILNKGQQETTPLFLSNSEIEERFNHIYQSQMKTLSTNRKAIRFDNSEYVLEVIKYDKKLVFMTIGVLNAANTVSLRSSETLESVKVPMNHDQALETFTYCMLDLSTGIITYICLNGTPSLSAVRDLFYDENSHTTASLVPIVTKDTLRRIASKEIINNFSVKIAVPCDKILSNDIGIPLDNFDKLQNIKMQNITLQVSAKRNTSLFSSSNSCLEFFNNIITKITNKRELRKLSVSARDSDEHSHSYSLLLEKFSQTIMLDKEDFDSYCSEDFMGMIENNYNEKKSELLEYIR